jgi:purine nucleosidase
MGATVPADHFHGANGLGDLTFAAPQAPLARQHAVHFICDTLRAAPEKSVSLAITGPMTNLALALLLAPDIALSVREIVIMGGAREAGGNVTASAEYNIYADAHAASIVLGSGLPIVLIGLDVTHKVRTTPERLAPFAASASPSARAIFDLLRFSEKVERQHAGCEGAPMHDPAVIAYLLDATLFETKPCSVQVETASPLTLGHTAIDLRSPGANAIRWAVDADAEGLFALLTRSIA